MIYITGDIHGSPERLGMHSFYEQKEMTRDDIVIICCIRAVLAEMARR